MAKGESARPVRVSKRNSGNGKNGGDLGFEATLYQSADKLRGQMDAAEYKHVVFSIPEYDEVVLVRKDAGATTVRRSKLPLDDIRREKIRKELDPERNEFFFATRLLLVEGDTEKLALPAYAERLALNLDRQGATIVEVGGKRNLPEFVRIAQSFDIPTGIMYDEDSLDDKSEEAKLNAELDAMAQGDAVKVWRISKDYEDNLRRALGEKVYLDACQRYPNRTKAIRARLIASEDALPIPEPVEDVLRWLARQPKEAEA